MATLQDLTQALINADAAGATQDARILAEAISTHPEYQPTRNNQNPPVNQITPAPKEEIITSGGIIPTLARGAKVLGGFMGEASKALEGPLSFFGIETGEKLRKRESEIQSQLESKGASKTRIGLTKAILPSVESGINAGMMAIGGPGVNFLKGTAALAGLNAGKALMSGLATEKDDAVGEALDVAESTALFDVGTAGVMRTGGGIARGLEKTGLPAKGKKLIQSSRIIQNLQKKIGNVGEGLKKSLLEFDEKITSLEGKRLFATPPVKERVINTSGIGHQIGMLDRDIDNAVTEMIEPFSKGIKNVGRKLGLKYDEILKTETGAIPVNLTDDIQEIGDALNIKPLKGRPQLGKIYKALKPFNKKSSVGNFTPSGLKTIKGAPSTSLTKSIAEGVSLRDAHWIKQALNDYSKNLRTQSSSQELGYKLKEIASNIDIKIDDLAPNYKALNSQYREFKDIERFLDSSVGRVKSAGDEPIRGGLQTISNEIRKNIKAGRSIDDELVRKQSNAIRITNSKIKLLADNGFIDDANLIKRSVDRIIDANLNKINLNKELIELKKIAKIPTDEFLQFKKEMEHVKKEISSYRLAKKRSQNEALRRSFELKKRGQKAEKVFDDAGLRSDTLQMEVSTLGDTIAGAAGSIPGVRSIVNVAKLASGYKTWIPKGSYHAKEILEKLDNYAKKITGPIRGPLAIYINKVKTSIEDESEEKE